MHKDHGEQSTCWGVLWRSGNTVDGIPRHLMYAQGGPVVFDRRAKVRAYIKSHYGYMKTSAALRQAPHGWRVPTAVKVKVVMG